MMAVLVLEQKLAGDGFEEKVLDSHRIWELYKAEFVVVFDQERVDVGHETDSFDY